MKSLKNVSAIFIGIVNSAIGSGGGIISVPLMKRKGLNQKEAQATTLAVILPLTVISALIYIITGKVSFISTLRYIPFGFIGAVTGVKFMEKASNRFLRKIFAVFMIYTGLRIIFR